MQRLLLAFGAAASLAASVQAAQLDLEDASQLFQNTAIVRESPQMQKPSQTFMDILNDMKRRWKVHKDKQMAELEPWKVREVQKAKARHHGERPRPSPQPRGTAPPLTEEERKALEHEARIAKFGEAMTLIVREPTGREFLVKFRTQTRLQVLMHSMCKKLGVQVANTTFMHRDKVLEPLATAQDFGLVDQDVIEMDSDDLREMKAQKEAEEAKEAEAQQAAEEAASLKEKPTLSKDRSAANARLEKQLRTAKKNAKDQKEAKRKHDLKVKDMVTLKFLKAHGDGNEIQIAVKRNNWLQGTMQLVCKRLDIDCVKARFFFVNKKDGNRALLKPHDSARTLNLKEEELVMVRESP